MVFMRKRVYLAKNDCATPPQEDAPVNMRIQASNMPVKALPSRLQDASRRADVRLVRRISVLLELLPQQAPVPGLCERWGLSPAWLYAWQQVCILRGLDSLVYRHGGGCPEKLPPKQKQHLGELMAAGPVVVGCERPRTVTVDRRIAPPTAASERSMIVSCHAAPQCSDTCHAYLPGGVQLGPGFSRRGSAHVRLGDWHSGNRGASRCYGQSQVGQHVGRTVHKRYSAPAAV